MITFNYTKPMLHLHEVGECKLETMPDGLHHLRVDIDPLELEKLCEDIITQLRLQRMNEKGLPV